MLNKKTTYLSGQGQGRCELGIIVVLVSFGNGRLAFFGRGGISARFVFLALALFLHRNAEGERQLGISIGVDAKVEVAIAAATATSSSTILALDDSISMSMSFCDIFINTLITDEETPLTSTIPRITSIPGRWESREWTR